MNAPSDLLFILQALQFAADKHRNQKRKDAAGTPYINHPIDVALTLVEHGQIDDREMIAAALLHDTIEDTQTTPDEIAALFGNAVAALVMECTDNKSLPKEERKRLQIVTAPHKSKRAKQLKIADKISNIRSMGLTPPATWAPERVSNYFTWSESVVSGLRGVNPALDQLFDQELARARKQHAESLRGNDTNQ